ncbi:nitroreductase family deazaflavin-dependent oxidoreductase [Intrasporangium sp. DVR]|uniref:nitroreductase family deazaflavin-dependent oxidoreductase n=1 Tax=Intrasporangium sp. DVR TaxID=3127867 RepID=UPI00313A5A56
MPIPRFVTRWNKRFLNRAMVHLAGVGPVAELEHLGRRSGTTHRVPLMAFRDGVRVTIALTYGPDVDWLKNLEAAGGGRLHLGDRLLVLGPPHRLSSAEGLGRMPRGPRQILPLTRTTECVELGIRSERPFTGW